MVNGDRKQAKRHWWVRTALAAGGIGTAVAAFSAAWQPANSAPPATQTAPAPAPSAPAATAADSDYVTRPVAFIGRDTVITREELGEFLVLRRGADRIDALITRRIIEIACNEAGVEVSGGEIELSLAEDLKGLGGITQADFVKQVLRRYGKNLIEWKEDVIRPKLMVSKLCRMRVHATDDEIHDAFEARYGEKIEGRIIQWSDRKEAEAIYPKLRESEQVFSEQAKHQKVGPLAATGGKIKPINRHLDTYNPAYKEKDANDRIEAEAFRLQAGEVSNLIPVPSGVMVIKCDRRLPADSTINPSAVRDELAKEVTERKILEEIPKFVKDLRSKAQPRPVVGDAPDSAHKPYTPGCSRGRVVAYIFNNVPITREEFGEYLITRYAAESLELLVNKRIIDEACKAKGITIDRAEIEVALMEKIAASTAGDKDRFYQILRENHTTPAQYEEDVLRPQLQLTKLCTDHVVVKDEELLAAYAAYYGEKIECRLILWPREERKYAMNEYAQIRDSEQGFAEKAARQASHELAANGGHLMDGKKIRLIGRHTLGNEELERELFSLKPGEVSKLVETPEGIVVMKCDRRVPADDKVPLESVREKLRKDVTERKIQLEIPLVFAELRKKAEPRLLLKDPNRPVDLTAEVGRDLRNSALPDGDKPHGKSGRAPAGN